MVVGSDSVIALNLTLLESNLVTAFFDSPDQLNATSLAMVQWATVNVLSNTEVSLSSYTHVNSMKDLPMNFQIIPESKFDGCSDPWVNWTSAMSLFDPIEVWDNPGTLLNPLNIQWFIQTDGFNLQREINTTYTQQRFALENNASMNCLADYLKEHGYANKEKQAGGSLLKRTISLAMPALETHTPFQLASRSMASYNQEQGFDCVYYVSQVSLSSASICQGVDFANLTEI
jgi:hypothetical protein